MSAFRLVTSPIAGLLAATSLIVQVKGIESDVAVHRLTAVRAALAAEWAPAAQIGASESSNCRTSTDVELS